MNYLYVCNSTNAILSMAIEENEEQATDNFNSKGLENGTIFTEEEFNNEILLSYAESFSIEM